MVAFMIVAVTDGGPFFWLGPGAGGGERRKAAVPSFDTTIRVNVKSLKVAVEGVFSDS